MSTKTSFKRIAAVAAVALTLGGFSAVSANADVNADQLTHFAYKTCNTVDNVYTDCADKVADTSSVVINTAATYALGQSFVASSSADAATVTLKMTVNAYNGGGSTLDGTAAYSSPGVLPTITRGTNAAANQTNSNVIQTISSDGLTVTNTAAGAGTVNGVLTASFTPTMRGTYTFTFTAQTGTLSTVHTWTVVAYATATALAIPADTAISLTSTTGAANVTSTMVAGDTSTVASSSTDATVAVAKTANSGAAVATIKVFPVNAAGTDISAAVKLTATTTAGSVSIGGSATGQAAQGRSVSSTNAGDMYVRVYADGTNAVGTVTITGTSAGSTTPVVLGTKKVTFYGDAAAISTPVLSVNAINGALATTPLVAVANAGVLTATVTDAAGIAVPSATVYVVSADKTKIADQYVAYTSSSAGLVTAALNGLAQGTTTVTITTKSSATDASTTTISSAATSVRVGSNVIAKQTEAFDAATYVPGSLVTWTITAVDAAGLAVTDGTSVAWSLTSATLPTAASSLGSLAGLPATYKAGIVSFSFYAPLVAGTLKITGSDTSGTTAAVTTQTAEVAGGAAVDAAQAAQDAANEATDAANAATDAANNAMDSADAAQQAALDAGDKADAALAAVTDLASKVADIATQISALSSLVSKIAASVAKISAKIKA